MITAPIPMPLSPGEAFQKGFGLTDNLMKQILERNQLKQKAEQEKANQEQLERHFQENLKLSKASAGRAAQAAADAHRIAMQKLDPNYKFNTFKNMIKNLQQFESEMRPHTPVQSYIPSMPKRNEGMGRQIPQMDKSNQESFINQIGSGLNNPEEGDVGAMIASNPELLAQLQKFFPNQGSYIPSIQSKFPMESQVPSVPEMKKESYVPPIPRYEEDSTPAPNIPDYVPNKSSGLPGGLNIDDIIKGLTYQSLGLKQPANGVYKEPPEIKSARDLEAKKELAKYNHELKVEEVKTKDALKNKATRQKVIDAATADLPHLKETLRSLKIMKKISSDPKNNNMFGHWWAGHDKAAQMTDNPNAGTWQVHGLAPIIDAEMKMSSKGNQLALKSALANKANFAEERAVADNKLKASIDQIERRIKETEKIANESGKGGNEFSHMSDEQVRAIAEGR